MTRCTPSATPTRGDRRLVLVVPSHRVVPVLATMDVMRPRLSSSGLALGISPDHASNGKDPAPHRRRGSGLATTGPGRRRLDAEAGRPRVGPSGRTWPGVSIVTR